MLVFYLMLGAIGLSIYHSYRVIRRGGQAGALVDHMLEARREKSILAASGALAAVYAAVILVLSLPGVLAPAWIVLTPFLYLLGWSLPRLWMR
jgi:hypothetical protein